MRSIDHRWKQISETIEERRGREAGKAYTYPSIVRMARNLAGSLAEVAGDAVRGRDILVEDEEFLDRLEICCNCELFDPEQIRCIHESCGCFLKIKGRLATMCCPLYLWPGDVEKSLLGLETDDAKEETDQEEETGRPAETEAGDEENPR
jgi:hypothetical protein